MATLSSIYCYPVKGLNGTELPNTELTAHLGIPNDRRFAITRGLPADYNGTWMSSANFMVNSRVDNLQCLRLAMLGDDAIEVSTPSQKMVIPLNAPLSDQQKSADLTQLLASLDVTSEVHLAKLTEHSGPVSTAIWDYPDTPLSIINLATVRELAGSTGREIHPLRFRGNLMVDGIAPWEEFSWTGKILRIGDSLLEVIRPINRCPATSVNPETADRDFDMPNHLQEAYGHVYCGVYARVLKGGSIAPADTVTVAQDSATRFDDILHPDAPHPALWPRAMDVAERRALGSATLLALRSSGPWPMPTASIGQRVRFHLAPGCWTGAPLVQTTTDQWMVEIQPSSTDDPATEQLRNQVLQDQTVTISGPYGRAKNQ